MLSPILMGVAWAWAAATSTEKLRVARYFIVNRIEVQKKGKPNVPAPPAPKLIKNRKPGEKGFIQIKNIRRTKKSFVLE